MALNRITSDKSNNKFWSYVKSQRKDNSGISDLLENGKTVTSTDPIDKANILNTQFLKVFSKPCNTNYQTNLITHPIVYKTFLSLIVS